MHIKDDADALINSRVKENHLLPHIVETNGI